MLLHLIAFATLLAQSGELPPATQAGVISGRILSAEGKPASGTRVVALSADSNETTASLMGIGETDSDGRFTLTDIPPGRYYIAAGPLDVAAYFPGVFDRTKATVVTLASAARMKDVDFRMPAVPVTVKVSGRLIRPGGASLGVPHGEIRLTGTGGTQGEYSTMTDANGAFEFLEVRLGTYELTSASEGESREISVGALNATGLTLTAAPAFRLAGRVIREDGWETWQSGLRIVRGGGNWVFEAEVAADGSFDFPFVPGGEYWVEFKSGPIMTRPIITVANADRTDIQLVIPRAYRVAGMVMVDGVSPPPAEVGIIAPPWNRSRISADGAFEFPAIAPGSYVVELYPTPQLPRATLEMTVTNHDVIDIRWVVRSLDLADVTSLLESTSPLDQAWGGWLAGERGRADLAPLLVNILEARLADDHWSVEREVAIDTIADALIRFNTRVPLAVAQALYKRRPAQAVILLSRLGSEADPFLLTLLDSPTGLAWLASANLLLEHRAPGLAAAALRQLQLEATLAICDVSQPCNPVRRSFFSGCSCGVILHAPLPPWPGYRFERSAPADTVGSDSVPRELVRALSGPVPVSIERSVDPAGEFSASSSSTLSSSGNSGETRLTYIRAVAPGARITFGEFETSSIEWRGDEPLEAEKEAFSKDIESRYAMLLDDLRVAGAITAEEAAALAKPKLKLTVTDMRSRK